jgi:hypothetical protein
MFPKTIFIACQILGIVDFQIENNLIFSLVNILTNLR